MATNSKDPLQKLEVRGKGVGGFSSADVERRASELALIDNRTVVTEHDRAAARAEFRDSHLPDAVNIPVETFALRSETLPKEKMIIVYCNTGGRSYTAYRKLMKLA
jgi:rhodanese-related sulfurtransferase